MIKSWLIIYFLISVIFTANFSKIFAQQAPNNPIDNPAATVTIIGDSLTARAQDYLKTALPNAAIDPAVSRQWDEGLSILQDLASSKKLAPILVYALGTNGVATDAGVDQVMSFAGNSKVIFMTIYGNSDAAKKMADLHNPVITNALARYPGKIAIADWYTIASSNPTWFDDDPLRVHPNSEGTQAFAKTVINAIGGNLSPANTTSTANTVTSNMLCVKVGTPSQEKPEACYQTSSFPAGVGGTAPGGAASCPLVGKRVIGCGSFMSDPKYNRGTCAGTEPVNRGHCGTNYGCYKGSIEATLASRRSHSIDVDAPAGETVYLPTINGQNLTWTYQPGMSYSVAGGDGGGFGHVFTADGAEGRWVIHLLHTTPARIPPQNAAGTYQSGEAVTKIEATRYTHLHVNIGLNPSSPSGGSGWLDPESLGMCTS